jgi:hypothetical protein
MTTKRKAATHIRTRQEQDASRGPGARAPEDGRRRTFVAAVLGVAALATVGAPPPAAATPARPTPASPAVPP